MNNGFVFLLVVICQEVNTYFLNYENLSINARSAHLWWTVGAVTTNASHSAAISYMPGTKSLLFLLIGCITSNVVSTRPLLLTLSLCHLQGGDPIWWLRQGTQTCSHQTPSCWSSPELLWAPERHGTKPTLFQQSCSGVGVGRRCAAPPYHIPWACAYPRVRRPLNPECHRVCLITLVVAPGI